MKRQKDYIGMNKIKAYKKVDVTLHPFERAILPYVGFVGLVLSSVGQSISGQTFILQVASIFLHLLLKFCNALRMKCRLAIKIINEV